MESPAEIVTFFAGLGSVLCMRSIIESLAHAAYKVNRSDYPEYTKHSLKSGNAFAAIVAALLALAAWASYRFGNLIVAGAFIGATVVAFRVSMDYERRWNRRNAEKLPPSVRDLEELSARLHSRMNGHLSEGS